MDDEARRAQAAAIQELMKRIPTRLSEVIPMHEYRAPSGYTVLPPSERVDPFPLILKRDGVTIIRIDYVCGAIMEMELEGGEVTALRCNRPLVFDHGMQEVRVAPASVA